MTNGSRTTSSRISGVVRFVVLLGVVLLAGISLLVVFEVVPASVLKDTGIKIVMATGILGIAGAAIVLLSRSNNE